MNRLAPWPLQRLRRLQGIPRKRTLAGLGALAYVLGTARPVVLVGFGAVAVGRALLGSRCGKREA